MYVVCHFNDDLFISHVSKYICFLAGGARLNNITDTECKCL